MKRSVTAGGLGYLAPERMGRIPPQLRGRHEFCFYLHDNMLHLLQEADASNIRSASFNLTPEEHVAFAASPDDPIGVLLTTRQRPAAKQLLMNHVAVALWSDLLNFLYEALSTLEKRKFVVAHALLRKPLQENLIFVSWMLSDPDRFFDAFEASPSSRMTRRGLDPAAKLDIFRKSVEIIGIDGLFAPNVLYDIIYNKEMANGLAPLFHKALHLVTSHGQTMKTEELNLNFIFKNPTDDDVYRSIYQQLGYILLYAFLIEAELFSRVLPVDRDYVDRKLFIALAVYHALFLEGRSPLNRILSRTFSEFLKCPVCSSRMRLTKAFVPRLLISERATCRGCGADFRFPILWFLDRVKIKLR